MPKDSGQYNTKVELSISSVIGRRQVILAVRSVSTRICQDTSIGRGPPNPPIPRLRQRAPAGDRYGPDRSNTNHICRSASLSYHITRLARVVPLADVTPATGVRRAAPSGPPARMERIHVACCRWLRLWRAISGCVGRDDGSVCVQLGLLKPYTQCGKSSWCGWEVCQRVTRCYAATPKKKKKKPRFDSIPYTC